MISEHGGYRKSAFAVIVLALGGIFMDAYDFSSLAFGITSIKVEFGLDGFMTGVVNAAIMFGAVVGALAGGYLVDRFGRYRLFMADMIFFVVAALGSAMAPDEWWLIAFRFVMGIGIGLDLPVAMAFLAEFSTLRGKGNRSQRVNAWSPAWYAATGIGYAIVLFFFLSLPEAQQRQSLALRGRLRRRPGPDRAAGAATLHGRVAAVDGQPGKPPGRCRDHAGQIRPQCGGRRGRRGRALPPGRCLLAFLRGVVLAALPVQDAGRARGERVLDLRLQRGRLRDAAHRQHPVQAGPLATILSALTINLAFGVVGGLVGIATVSRFGSRKLALVGFSVQTVSLVVLALLASRAGRS